MEERSKSIGKEELNEERSSNVFRKKEGWNEEKRRKGKKQEKHGSLDQKEEKARPEENRIERNKIEQRQKRRRL